MGAAQLTFKGCQSNIGSLARLGLYAQVCVGWFPVHRCGESAVVLPRDEDIEKRDGIVLFFLSSKLDSAVHIIEAFIEILDRIFGLSVTTSEAGTFWRVDNRAPTVVHIYLDVSWYSMVSLAR